MSADVTTWAAGTEQPAEDTVDWSSYAKTYDWILDHNPAYGELLDTVRAEIDGWDLPPGARVLDLGAGTGNFSLLVAQRFPQAEIVHVDFDPGMNVRAEEKRLAAGLSNVRIVTRDARALDYENGAFDAVLSVHALYTMPDPEERLHDLRRWLKPGGRALLCDVGRVLEMGDWIRFFIPHLLRDLGLFGTLRAIWGSREVLRQNRRIRRMQDDGTYWLHSHEEFVAAVQGAGFSLERSEVCFQGCSDLVIGGANAPPSSPPQTARPAAR